MSTLRTVAANNHQSAHNFASAASTTTPSSSQAHDPEARCRKCLHLHKNKHCFKQHPELATGEKGERWKEGMRKKAERRNQRDVKGKGKAVAGQDDESDYDSEEMSGYLDHLLETNQRNDGGIAASASTSYSNKVPIIYDTGASHHFMLVKSMFSKIHKRSKPFRFDQAVGASSLTEQGTALIKLGCHNFYLHECLYSPGSASGIISEGRLKRIAYIQPDYSTNVLIKHVNGSPDQPIARLALINDVYYIRPLLKHQHDLSRTIAAPGVARIPTTSSAQRWHQRLGHISQHILKKTITHSVGLEGVKLLNSTHAKHATLPLDEIFVDTVGKLVTSIDQKQYAVIITDAKTRMRWVLTTNTKDQIADTLVQWIKAMHHQYEKRVRAIFRDGGSEFSKTKTFCEQQGIRTDTSSPHTPEQNGPSEAANKVVLRVTRSMLIDAKMPPCYWSWAIQHACFILNRLYCIRTKKVPIIDFLKGLRQPHWEKVDLRNIPRFGCRAYKLTQPKPGKFEPRAEKGWFMGFQTNTSKNFLILYPHQTPIQGCKWVVSFTPHATFNEDDVFGNNMSSINKQQTLSYWEYNHSPNQHHNLSSPIINLPKSPKNAPSPDLINQTRTSSSTGQPSFASHSAPSGHPDYILLPVLDSASSHTNQPAIAPQSTPGRIVDTTPPPTAGSTPYTPVIQPDVQSTNTTAAPPETPPVPASTWMESTPSPLSSELTDTDSSEETEEISSHDTYRSSENNTPSNDSTCQHNVTSQDNNELTLASEPDTQYDNIMTGWDPIPPIAGHKRPHSPEVDAANRKRGKEKILTTGNTNIIADRIQTPTMPQISGQMERAPNFDSDDYTDERIMTGWTPVKPLAGQKRDHSPEGEIMFTKRGRKVKRVDYNRLHHGLSANESSDPKTWEEEMTSPESRQWKIAALEEFRSLLKTGTIKIINRDSLPKGRKPMRCKWGFKKKFLADGSVDKWKARCTAKGFTQRPGIDYQETFAPTPRPETGRIMLVLAHHLG
ncbi:hypothetical protein K3495_g4519 [Podosphaera aphanis]|nr:hypothetical protein K3495_g4519 [Podosphaera aphanis]